MIPYPDIDSVALYLGPFKLRWYGLMYMIGFAVAWGLGRYRASRSGSGWTARQVDDLVVSCIVGVILGGRIGYVLFYQPGYFLENPLDLLAIWKGGMSFHGGVVGVALMLWAFARKNDKGFFEVSDFALPLAPQGLIFSRIGNFINGELWGRVTDVPWAMVFPNPAAGPYPRHPSQLYQSALEGLLLFLILWIYSSKRRPTMAVTGLFLLGYGTFRFAVEFVRQPDGQLGFIAFDWLTMGQLLSAPMVLAGAIMLWLAYAKAAKR